MIKEVHSSKLVVEAPKFKCDSVISKQIEEPLPNTAFAMALIGSAGSGKTSLMINMLTSQQMYKHAFDHVHLVAPKSSMGSLQDDIWKNHPAEKIHNELDFFTLDTIFKKSKDRAHVKPKPETTLVIIDDMTIWLKVKTVENKLREMIFNRRHNYTSIMILVQSYKSMPLDLRKTLSHFFLFKPRNKKESEAIWEELMFIPKSTGDELMRFAYRESYDFLMGNCNTGDLHRNFNRLVLPEDTTQDPDENLDDAEDE